jgi:hypothetical protein
VLPILEQPVEQPKHRTITNPSTSPRTQSGYADTGWTSGLRLVMRGSGSGSENKIANREPFWEPDHAANLVQPRTCTENTSAVLSVKADLPDQSERLVEAYGSGGLRGSRSVCKYMDRFIRARVAAAMAPAHQYQPPSVTAATIKPAASTTSVVASPSRHHRGNPELTL